MKTLTFKGNNKAFQTWLTCPACQASILHQCTKHAEEEKEALNNKINNLTNK